MKRWFSILVLSIFLLHFAGFYIYFLMRLHSIHIEMKAALKKLPNSQLTRLVLTKAEYQSIDNNEIEIYGSMYDVARVSIEANQVIIYALQDRAENDLISFLKDVIRNSEKDKQQAPTELNDFSTLNFIVPSIFATLPVSKNNGAAHYFYCKTYPNISLDIPCPPPWS